MRLHVALLVLLALLAGVRAADVRGRQLTLEDPGKVIEALKHKDDSMGQDPERFQEQLHNDDAAVPEFFDSDDSSGEDVEARSIADPPKSNPSSKGLRSAAADYRFRGTSQMTLEQHALYLRFMELRQKEERSQLSASEKDELRLIRQRGFFKSVANFAKKAVSAVGNVVKKVASVAAGVVTAVSGGPAATGKVDAKTGDMQKMLAVDIQDCVGCRFVWLAIELEVGNSMQEESIYDSFVKNCMEAEKAPIFFQTCQDMFDDVYGMIGDYMNGYTVNQVCEGAKMCR